MESKEKLYEKYHIYCDQVETLQKLVMFFDNIDNPSIYMTILMNSLDDELNKLNTYSTHKRNAEIMIKEELSDADSLIEYLDCVSKQINIDIEKFEGYKEVFLNIGAIEPER